VTGALIGILLLLQAASAPQPAPVLTLTDGRALGVVTNVEANITAVTIGQVEFEATVLSQGRANTLSDAVLDAVRVRDRTVHREIRQITTSIALLQGDTRFYIRALNTSGVSRFAEGRPRVRCRAYLLEIRSGASVLYLPVITSIRPAISPGA
jgi:hypothetical protein